MKKNKFILKFVYCLVFSAILSSCTKDFTEINTNEKDLTADALAKDAALLGKVFAQAEYASIYQNSTPMQYAQNWSADLYVQYFALTTSEAEADRYDFTDFWSQETWEYFFNEAAPHIKAVEDISLENDNLIGNAMAKILKVFAYSRMTDHYGPMIYSQFGNGELAVPYDSQESIYSDFFVQLDEAVAVLKANPGAQMFTSDDVIYGGSADKWLKFANSLRLRFAVHIRLADAAKAKAEAEKAIAEGVFETSSEDAFVNFTDAVRSPYPLLTEWSEFRMSATMESVLKGYEDPRIPSYFTEAVDGDTDGDGVPFEGIRNGQLQSALTGNVNDGLSDMSLPYKPLFEGGTNGAYEVMSASEAYFLRAEGALQGWNMGGAAKDLYEEGIRVSLLTKTDADGASIDAYISSANTPVPYEAGAEAVADIPVAFSADPETQLEQIITQKWISIYPNGWEAWVDLRRTGYPKRYDLISSDNADVGASEIMRRIQYPSLEADTNPEGLAGALALPEMQGGDNNATRVWWDKN